MATVRAKFRLLQNVESHNGTNKTKTVHLHPVSGGSEENKVFSKFSPSGKIEIFMTEDAPAYNYFELGKEYYVDFTPAEEATPAE